MHEIYTSIHRHLPWLGLRMRALLDALLLSGASIGTAREVACRLGFGNRFHLAKILRANGLPPLHRLAAWMTVLSWVKGWEQEGVALSSSALRIGTEPAAAYRLVARTTGHPWSEIRAAGTEWAVSRFVAECGEQATSRKQKRRGKIPAASYNPSNV
jgi:hypothetical protein